MLKVPFHIYEVSVNYSNIKSWAKNIIRDPGGIYKRWILQIVEYQLAFWIHPTSTQEITEELRIYHGNNTI